MDFFLSFSQAIKRKRMAINRKTKNLFVCISIQREKKMGKMEKWNESAKEFRGHK